jgi:mannose-6-phosphate isomerase-like protein (cupin superfamily)
MTKRWHRLGNTSERYVILSGCGCVGVGTRPAETVDPGAVVLIPAGVAQRIANAGDDDLVFLAICKPRFEHSAYEDIDA